jgi:hypothetical protein
LTATATDIGEPGRDDECGFGILNIVKALTADVPPLQTTTTATPSAAATSAAPAATAPTSASSPETTPTSKTTVFVVLGVIVVLGLGGVFAFLASRRRKTP